MSGLDVNCERIVGALTRIDPWLADYAGPLRRALLAVNAASPALDGVTGDPAKTWGNRAIDQRRSASRERVASGHWARWQGPISDLKGMLGTSPMTVSLIEQICCTDLTGYSFPRFLDAAGWVFPTRTAICQAHFAGDGWFSHARFEADCDFGQTRFAGLAAFENATFVKSAAFGGAEFAGAAEFRRVQYLSAARFEAARFRGDAWLRGSSYNAAASFERAEFEGEAGLGDSVFRGPLDCSAAIFRSNAGFEASTFEQPVNFADARFMKTAWFSGSRFSHAPCFDRAHFSGQIRLDDCEFPAPQPEPHRMAQEIERRLGALRG